MAPHRVFNATSLPGPKGFSYAVGATGEQTVYFAGHTAVNAQGRIVAPGDLLAQFEQVLSNLMATAEAAGVELSDLVKLSIFVTDVQTYQAASRRIGEVYRRFFGSHYPAVTLVSVARLWDEEAMIEIDGVAVK